MMKTALFAMLAMMVCQVGAETVDGKTFTITTDEVNFVFAPFFLS